MARKSYPSDVSDEEWSFVAPYLTLMKEDAPQREHDLREVFDALRWMVRSGSPWRYLPNDFPRWDVVYQQTQRWLRAGCFEAMVHDLRLVLRVFHNAIPHPAPQFTIAAPCLRHLKAVSEQDSTGIRRRKARRFMWPLILLAICWH